MDEKSSADAHYRHSVLREKIAEHAFIGDALRRLWQLGVTDVEILKSEFDAGGYDLVMTRGSLIRHIQFKTVSVDGKAARTTASLKLAERPSGCVIWMVLNPDLTFASFLWFGGPPGSPLPSIGDLAIAKHSKGNADGVKLARPGHRVIPRGQFDIVETLEGVLERLLGQLT